MSGQQNLNLSDNDVGDIPWLNENYNGAIGEYTSSSFRDVRWNFRARVGYVTDFIDFDFSFASGGKLFSLLESSKLLWITRCYLLARLRPHDNRKGGGAESTVKREWNELKRVICWMVTTLSAESFEVFDDPNVVDRYIEYARSATQSPHHLSRALAPLGALFEERDRMPEAGRISKAPYRGRSYAKVANFNPQIDRAPFPRLPDNVAIPVLKYCEDFLGQNYSEAIELFKLYREKTDEICKSIPSHTRRHRVREILWESGDTEIANKYIQPLDVMGRKIASFIDVRNLVSDIRVCAIAIIGCFAGLRIGEILSLSPDCLTGPEQSEEGTLDIFWLNGRIVKNARSMRGSEEHTWVAGARPSGSQTLVPVVRAIEVLNAFRSSFHPHSKTLIIGLVRDDYLYSSHFSGVFNRVFHRVLSENASVASWSFCSSQFRKTCSYYIGRRHRHGAGLIAEQYGHTRYATSLGYMGTDSDLNADFVREASTDAAEELAALANAGAIGGDSGVRITGALQKFRAKFSNQEDFVRALTLAIQDKEIEVFFAEWGACIYHQGESKCKGGRNSPNYLVRSPDVCLACKNLAISKIHRPFHEWRSEYYQRMVDTYPWAAEVVMNLWIARRDLSKKAIGEIDSAKT